MIVHYLSGEVVDLDSKLREANAYLVKNTLE